MTHKMGIYSEVRLDLSVTPANKTKRAQTSRHEFRLVHIVNLVGTNWVLRQAVVRQMWGRFCLVQVPIY